MMDEIWKSFMRSKKVNAYVAGKENAIVLCSSGPTARDALIAIGNLMENYDEPIPIASSFYFENDTYYTTVVLSGYQGG